MSILICTIFHNQQTSCSYNLKTYNITVLLVLGLFPEMPFADPVPSRGVPGQGFKPDQPLGSLCAPPCTGQNYDPG